MLIGHYYNNNLFTTKMKKYNCRVCNKSLSATFVFREMMFGFRDEFGYAECSNCNAIQILEVPDNIEKYYPPYYVSFTQQVPVLKRLPYLKRLINDLRIKIKYKNSNGQLIEFLRPAKTKPDAKILDIGCGKGALICSLFNFGFEKVSGVDKFIPDEVDHGYGVKVYKKDLYDLESNLYDLLILNHVLEHVDDQISEIKECYRLLKTGGTLIVSVPVVGTAWEIYKENWVQLDAPRHFVLHTLKSMAILAQKTGFIINKTVFDSTAFQFWGSELYKKNIPLTLPNTHDWFAVDKGFSSEEIQKFEKEAKVLNATQKGDTARFYFYKY
ncbi:MAG: hypothetical protein JWP44_3536 [Mucilaginibacter sp.]|nr:hypothetical protein [Mucilaginibacter sp.]